MWVEPDMNLPSGESIVRQLVHGQRFFEEHFGRRCTEVWIPDAFGYPASLPQLFVAGGCTRFVTQKLSWNKENRFPHSTFWWEGIDGTRVLTHFPPVETYNAVMEPAEQVRLERQFHEHGWSDWSLTPYGYGDGGGGPTRETPAGPPDGRPRRAPPARAGHGRRLFRLRRGRGCRRAPRSRSGGASCTSRCTGGR